MRALHNISQFLPNKENKIVQGIRAKILQNLKQIGIGLNLVWLEAKIYVEYRVKTPPEDTLGKFFYG